MAVMFIHGVPETGAIWEPLVKALDIDEGTWRAPTYPGFGSEPQPEGFNPTLENYALWLADQVDELVLSTGGPIDIVGHDFGAALALRVSSTHPQNVRSWSLMNSLIDSSLKPHLPARLLKAPWIGRLILSTFRSKRLMRRFYLQQGVPIELADQEASNITIEMRRCISSIYRSSDPQLAETWEAELNQLPQHGLLIFGDRDPYVPITAAQRFANCWDAALHIETGAGHWAFAEHPNEIALVLKSFWRNLKAQRH